ncbi:PREDICTED: galanin receptor type 2-like [Priapulus caudatus]|uniref:Galanin receptor type 2-like n=1 Tax=Priapulus caudatus TaxID=37621 RepID=A0ABM1F0D9_PRICU|nr:PREDICTED: galanin receptor type 2-like [Priapulus caudatus]
MEPVGLETWNNGSFNYNEFANLTFNDTFAWMSRGAQACLTLLYSLTVIASVFGNVSVIIVFSCGKLCRSTLAIFLINLALSDIVMAAFCMPFTFSKMMLHAWIYPSAFCPIVLFLQTVSVSSSIYTLLAIGVDRFLAIKWPLHSRFTR